MLWHGRQPLSASNECFIVHEGMMHTRSLMQPYPVLLCACTVLSACTGLPCVYKSHATCLQAAVAADLAQECLYRLRLSLAAAQ